MRPLFLLWRPVVAQTFDGIAPAPIVCLSNFFRRHFTWNCTGGNLALAQIHIALQYGFGRECEPGSKCRALSHAYLREDRHDRHFRDACRSVPIRRRQINQNKTGLS
ncbi:hypothetical protein, partial [Mesorhizobium sp. M7A.F.Ca.CA.004.08.2.1]|uniref:hypothetical protein n=1 Tax=Mesorhizobium sp. M7A.F.Ca.CA.004.08.2.1 TaxID=2496731 RepID=UPI0019D41466